MIQRIVRKALWGLFFAFFENFFVPILTSGGLAAVSSSAFAALYSAFDKEDARSLLEGEKVYPCYYPTNRSLKALVKNTKIAWDVLHKEKPDLIVSCGAAVAVPFFYIGKMMGAKVVYRGQSFLGYS